MTKEEFLEEAARIHREWETEAAAIHDLAADRYEEVLRLRVSEEVYHARIDALMDQYHPETEAAAQAKARPT